MLVCVDLDNVLYLLVEWWGLLGPACPQAKTRTLSCWMMYKAFIHTVNEEDKNGGLTFNCANWFWWFLSFLNANGYFDTKETGLAAVTAMEGRFFYENAARDNSLGWGCSKRQNLRVASVSLSRRTTPSVHPGDGSLASLKPPFLRRIYNWMW